MSTIAARSNNGCWTCRARRKKCDEGMQPCLTCVSLQLKCHGYGPKPEWMDGDVKEKAQARIFKEVVRRSLVFKRKRRDSLRNEEFEALSQLSPYKHKRSQSEVSSDTASSTYTLGLNQVSMKSSLSPELGPSISVPSYGQTLNLRGEYYEQIIPEQFRRDIGVDALSCLSATPIQGSKSNDEFSALFSPSIAESLSMTHGINTHALHENSSLMRDPVLVHHQTRSDGNYSDLERNLMGQTAYVYPNLIDAISSTLVDDQLQTCALHELTATRYYLESLLPSQFPFWTSETSEAVCRLILTQVKGVFYTYAMLEHQ